MHETTWSVPVTLVNRLREYMRRIFSGVIDGRPRKTLGLLIVSIAAFTSLGCAGFPFGGYRPHADNVEARRVFQDAKFGMFIDWGPYSVLEKGAHVMADDKMSARQYETVADRFDPTDFDPSRWVALAEEAGMKYITVNAKRHGGFSMFDTIFTDFDIVDHSPYGKDVLAPLAEACRERELKLFFYYSQLDWHHPDYYPRGETGAFAGRPDEGFWERYLDFMDGQLGELLTNYGEIGGIRLDGTWDKPEADWRLEETYRNIHRLQRQALIGNNHHRAPLRGEDFQIFVKDLPGRSESGFNPWSDATALPIEVSETIGKSWGYDAADTEFKSTRELIRLLVRAAGHNANLLLNVGPRPDGTIQPEFAERLRAMGRWLAKNGESLYGTRGGPVQPGDWGVAVSKDDKIYIHYLASAGGELALPAEIGDLRTAYLFSTGASIDAPLSGGHYILDIPERILDPIDTIIVLDFRS